MDTLSVPQKQCNRKENCIHPEAVDGGWLPATLEYFYYAKYGRNQLAAPCKRCIVAQQLRVYHNPELKKKRPEPRTGFKVCTRCEQEYPATSDYFKRRAKSPDGLAYWCNSCANAYKREQTAKNPSEWTLLIQQQATLRGQGLKLCTQCGKIKPLTDEYFWRQPDTRDGFHHWCKHCLAPDHKAYRIQTRERRAQQHRLWMLKHPGYEKEWAKANPDKRREIERRYNLKHPEKAVESSARRRARKLEQGGDFTVTDWQRALAYWEYRCAGCGRPADLWTVLAQDHWYPLSKGGAHDPTNIVPLCHSRIANDLVSCNVGKHNCDPLKWLAARFGSRKANAIQKRIAAYFQWVTELETSTGL